MNEKAVLLSSCIGEEFCTTRQAAKMLGLSMGSVQQMVENGVLAAWKTKGGHRRVSIKSVQEQLQLRNSGQPVEKSSVVARQLNVLIAEDDLMLQKLYKVTFESWKMPISLEIVGSGFHGLLKIGEKLPDILMLDLKMPGMDGFEMIRTLRTTEALQNMDIIVVTGMSMEQIENRGGLPECVTVYEKPVPFTEIRGYFQAKTAQLYRGMLSKSN